MSTRRANGEGSRPIQRKDGRWAVGIRYIDPDGLSKRTYVYGKTAKEAREKAEAVRERVKAGRPAKDAKTTLATFVEDWIEGTLAVSDRKSSTKSMYATLARKHVAGSDLGARSLDRLEARHVEAWVAALRRKGLSESTVRSTYTVLRAILDTAVRDRAIAENPAAVVRRPKVTVKEAAYMSDDQVEAVLQAAAGSRYAPMFVLLDATGLRRGEALALRWTDVNLGARTLRVRGTLGREGGELVVTEPKTARSVRTIPLIDEAVEVLQEVKARQQTEQEAAGSMWTQTGFVFTTEFGAPCDPRNALRAFKAAADRAGVPGVGLHTLRHSSASRALGKGVPLKVVSEIWGHSSVSITGDIYGHVAPDLAAEAMKALSRSG